MSINKELSKRFDRFAKVLEILGANRFKVIAFQKASRVLSDMTEDVSIHAGSIKELTALDGIGKGIAEKIKEYVETSAIEEFDDVESTVPEGVLAMLDISGLGPKTIAMFWRDAGIDSIQTLKEKLETDELESLPRMGKKSLDKIRKSISFSETSAGRIHMGDAFKIANKFMSELKSDPRIKRLEYAGSLRRGKDTIGDIDLLAGCDPDDQKEIHKLFCSLPDVKDVLVSGDTKSSIVTEKGTQVDLRTLPMSQYGAAYMYFTGSKEHNVALRELAIKQNMRLNEYGLWNAEDDHKNPDTKAVASDTEESIYKALNLNWIPPELREARGEIALAESDTNIKLIEVSDIKAELHAHTIASDGAMTIVELATNAKERGFHTIAVTDHSVSQPIANGLSIERLEKHIDDVHNANKQVKGIRILAGSEVDILSDGKMDYPDELLARLDIVIGSPHVALSQEPAKATARLIAAIENPYVHIIGHPTGRLINRREGLQPDMMALIKAAKATKTVFEINANHWRLDLRDIHAKSAIEAGVKLVINTDTHYPADFDQLKHGVLTAKRAGATKKDVVNCMTAKQLETWLTEKRKHMGAL